MSSCGLSQDAIVLVTDCATADMFAITNNPISGGPDKDTLAHGNSNNLQPKLQGRYGPGSQIYNLHGAVLYIGKGASGEPALFRRQASPPRSWWRVSRTCRSPTVKIPTATRARTTS